MAEKTTDTIHRNARDLYERALGALERNNLEYAIEMFRQCLAIEPNFTRGRQYLRAAQSKSASSSALRRVVSAAYAAPKLTQAKMAIQKSPGDAMNIAEQVLTGDPRNSQALLLLAEAAEAGGYLETTIQTLEYYSKLNVKDLRSLHWLARSYGAVKNYEGARDTYERILQINPANFEAQKGLKDVTAHGAMQGGGWDDAKSYRDVIKDKDEAISLEQQHRVVRAEDMVENLIQEQLARLRQDPDNPVIRRELGKLYAQKGEYKSALSYLEKLAASEGGADAAMEREISEIKSKVFEVEITTKKKQLETNPANAAALANEIAKLERELDQIKLGELQRLADRYPNDLMYRFDLAVQLMKLDQIQDAIGQFQKSVGQPQKRIASLNYLGLCFQKEGLHDIAIEQYSKAIEELPTMDNLKKDLIYNRGTAYEAMGEEEKALADFKTIAAVDYGYRDVRQRSARKPAK